MRIWIDTEFNGFGGELLSIALVAEDGSEFYEILSFPANLDPWVVEHVYPVMNVEGDNIRVQKLRPLVRREMQQWLHQFDSIHIIGDWPEDIAHFCRLLLTETPGQRISTPPLTLEITRIDSPSKVPHNALSDARGMRDRATKSCSVPPAGWECSREPGHSGPCAARPTGESQ